MQSSSHQRFPPHWFRSAAARGRRGRGVGMCVVGSKSPCVVRVADLETRSRRWRVPKSNQPSRGAGEGRGSYAGGSLGVTCPSGILLRQRRLSQPRGFERVGLVQEREGRDALPVPRTRERPRLRGRLPRRNDRDRQGEDIAQVPRLCSRTWSGRGQVARERREEAPCLRPGEESRYQQQVSVRGNGAARNEWLDVAVRTPRDGPPRG